MAGTGPSAPPTAPLRPHPPEAPEASSGQATLLATLGPGRTRAVPHPSFLSPWGVGAVSACPPCSRQWLEDALRENEPGACFLFLVGTKKDLLVSGAGQGQGRPRETWPLQPGLAEQRVTRMCLRGNLQAGV